MFSEEGVRPTKVIACRSAKAGTLLPLTQDCSQPPPNESVNVAKRRPVSMFEISKPAPEEGVELADDRFQATASCTSGLFADLVPKCLAAFRTQQHEAAVTVGGPQPAAS